METKVLNGNGGNIAYDDQGTGPLVICVPGMGDLRSEYRYLVPRLVAAGYRAVSMDLRGHGESSTGRSDYGVAAIGADILDLARHLNAGPVVITGNSMAAGAAVWAAVEAPEQVSGLVLIGPAVHGEVNAPYRLLLNILFARPWGVAAWMMYYKTLFPTRKPADLAVYAAELKRNLSEPGRLEALKQSMLASKADSEARLARVSIPSLVLMGSKDPDFKDPEAEANWVAGQLGVRGVVRMIEGAGHYPQTEMPEITAPLVLDFLKTLMPEAARAG